MEEREDPSAWEANLDAKCKLLKELKEHLPGQATFMPAKVKILTPQVFQDG